MKKQIFTLLLIGYIINAYSQSFQFALPESWIGRIDFNVDDNNIFVYCIGVTEGVLDAEKMDISQGEKRVNVPTIIKAKLGSQGLLEEVSREYAKLEGQKSKYQVFVEGKTFGTRDAIASSSDPTIDQLYFKHKIGKYKKNIHPYPAHWSSVSEGSGFSQKSPFHIYLTDLTSPMGENKIKFEVPSIEDNADWHLEDEPLVSENGIGMQLLHYSVSKDKARFWNLEKQFRFLSFDKSGIMHEHEENFPYRMKSKEEGIIYNVQGEEDGFYFIWREEEEKDNKIKDGTKTHIVLFGKEGNFVQKNDFILPYDFSFISFYEIYGVIKHGSGYWIALNIPKKSLKGSGIVTYALNTSGEGQLQAFVPVSDIIKTKNGDFNVRISPNKIKAQLSTNDKGIILVGTDNTYNIANKNWENPSLKIFKVDKEGRIAHISEARITNHIDANVPYSVTFLPSQNSTAKLEVTQALNEIDYQTFIYNADMSTLEVTSESQKKFENKVITELMEGDKLYSLIRQSGRNYLIKVSQ